MERQALRAALLAFLVAITVPGAPSEASGSETEPDFIVTIRSNGVQENTQQVFSLRPSATLRVVDESAKAFFLPQSATAVQDSAPGYNFAYVFENGRCNFERTVAYKDAFPGHSQPLWVRSAYHENAGGNAPEDGIPIYTFTNPPAERLNGGVSFCVRFTTDSAATSTTTTSPTTAAVVTTSDASATSASTSADSTASDASTSPGGGSTGPSEESGGGTSAEDSGSELGPSEPSTPSDGNPQNSPSAGEGSHEIDQEGSEALDGDGSSAATHPSPGLVGPSEQQDHINPPTPGTSPEEPDASNGLAEQSQNTQHSTSNGSSPLAGNAHASGAEELNTAQLSKTPVSQRIPPATPVMEGAASEDLTARLRRLSDTNTSAVKYLTIVVHSAAAGSSAGTLTLSGALLSVVATLMFAFCF
ncbi:Toxoplasma gondii family A protein [Toxoplasma gondii GAB2-2007-GAL-DOM2]|uniref:Toxoplasma gondii family A protein n=5 Tax=Toxoplasma gondii TaxID=5811 RepID=S7W7C1_TOXGG|nr:Toxoplasma gondii family A protein [Toxoplasma gondii GT1]KAF4643259.1 Toxoplasma gondii family A protein [Toxoplasma gondii]KFG32979.1 Toxoplasma gondii family A protein [Toxoplasma gondii GAB2-2007-GAL-DOM2]RQX69082.1 Toxoplasma gondii family A protein [Toxoplasma gondii CAST]